MRFLSTPRLSKMFLGLCIVALAACESTTADRIDEVGPAGMTDGVGGQKRQQGTDTSTRTGTTATGAGGTGTGTPTGTPGAASTLSTTGTPTATSGSPIDLCAGLVTDKQPRPMTALAKPALGATATDAEFGTKIRRISAVPVSGPDPAIRPLYSTVSAWNADETRLLLYNVQGGHELYDGKTYAFLHKLDIHPADLEQVYWHTTDPDILYYVDGKNFIRYHVGSGVKDTLTTFSFCSASASGGDDPMFTSFDSARVGLHCGTQEFIYDIASNIVIAQKTLSGNPAQIAPSGTLAYSSDTGQVSDTTLNVVRKLDLLEPFAHASMGRIKTGQDTWNGVVYDNGPKGNSDIGSLVTWDMTNATSRVTIGPKTGFPYPPDGHVSAMAIKQPGWVFVSTLGDTSGKGLLDMEMLIANTNPNETVVCRVGRHRSWGKDNTKLAASYWAEPHTVASPRGTRATFASDWGNGTSVDTYVLELPSYVQ